MRHLIKCSACGHFGHRSGSRCPFANLVQDSRTASKQDNPRDVFPHRPDLALLLEAVRASWLTRRAA